MKIKLQWSIPALFTVLAGTVVGTALTAYLIRQFSSELPAEDLAKITESFTKATVYAVKPERREQLSYVGSILTLPLWSLLMLAVTANRKLPGVFSGILSIAAVLWGIVCYAMPGDFRHLCARMTPAGFLIALLLFAGFWYCRRREILSVLPRKVIFLLCLIPALIQIFINRIYFPEYVEIEESLHLGVVAQAISIAASGVVAPSQYGFYPYFLLPVWKFFGTNIYVITFVMNLLFLLTMGGLLFLALRMVRHKILLGVFAVALTLCTGTWMSFFFQTFDPYFQYHPVRSLFIVLALLGAWFFRHHRSIRNASFFGLFAGISFWWNADSGMVICACVSGWMGWHLICERSRKAVSETGAFLLSMAGALGAGAGILHLSGVDLHELLTSQNIFYVSGFYMIPMPGLPHFWSVILLIFAISFVIGLAGTIRSPHQRFASLLLLGGAFGFGLFTYYQGRSYDIVLSSVTYLTLFLVLLLLDRTLSLLRRHPELKISACGFLLFLVIPCAVSLSQLPVAFRLTGQVARRMTCRKTQYTADYDFIKSHLPPDKVCCIVGIGQGFYYAHTGAIPGFFPSNQEECILKRQFSSMLQSLVTSKKPLFVIGKNPFLDWKSSEPFLNTFFELKAVSSSGKIRYFLPRVRSRE